MAVFTIAGLTIKEAIRRKTLLGALLLGLLVMGLSFMLIPMQRHNNHLLAMGRINPVRYAMNVVTGRAIVISLCLSSIKSLGALFSALLAGGAISGEIESGLLSVILSRPVPRWQILLGKWIGINLILVCSTLVWTFMIWVSFNQQSNVNVSAILYAGPLLALFPMLLSTVTLTISTVAPRLFGTVIAVTVGALAWFDGIFNALGNQFDVDILRWIADLVGLIVPQGYVGWWVEGRVESLIMPSFSGRGIGQWQSPEFLTQWGETHLHFAHLDIVYVITYIVVVFLGGIALFQKRDI